MSAFNKASIKSARSVSRFLSKIAALLLVFITVTAPAVSALETWEKLDKRLKGQVYQITVGLKLKLKDGLFAQLADLSPKGRFPVYSVYKEDKGFRVIAFGSSFAVRTNKHDTNYFLTNAHVVECPQATPIINECERFFSAMRLYAEQTGGGNTDGRFIQLLQIVNLATKGAKNLVGSELQLYQTTVDAIWDTYENSLSKRVDPSRVMFDKYSKMVGLQSEIHFFLHAPGPVSLPALEGQIYKIGKGEGDPDIAILTAAGTGVTPMDFDVIQPTEGQDIQAIGYPLASEQLDLDPSYRAPTFSTGRISRVTPRLLQVDAPITNGNSGGPVVSTRGKVVGMVAQRALTSKGVELVNFAGAITRQSIEGFAPDLFSKTPVK